MAETSSPSPMLTALTWLGRCLSALIFVATFVGLGALLVFWIGPGALGLTLAIVAGLLSCAVVPWFLDQRVTRAFRKLEPDAKSTFFQTLAGFNVLYLALLVFAFPASLRAALIGHGAWFAGGASPVQSTVSWVAGFLPAEEDEAEQPEPEPETATSRSSDPPSASATAGVPSAPTAAASTASAEPKKPQSAAEKLFEAEVDRVVVIETVEPLRAGDPTAMLFKRMGFSNKRGSGSGFIVAANGLVVTAAHVIKNVASVRVRLHDGRAFDDVTRVAKHGQSDLALLQIDADELPAVTLAPKDAKPNVGANTIAIGSPLGLEFSLTEGAVSSLRTLHGSQLIQTQAPLAAGVSGGPLFDEEGKVIAVNTASEQPGFGLATRVTHLHELLEAPREKKKYTRYSPGPKVESIQLNGAETPSTTLEQLSDFFALMSAGAETCIRTSNADSKLLLQYPAPPAGGSDDVASLFQDPTLSGNLSDEERRCLERILQMTGRLMRLFLGSEHAEELSDGSGIRLDVVFSGLQSEAGDVSDEHKFTLSVELLAAGGKTPDAGR